jgi:hypothetical protein
MKTRTSFVSNSSSSSFVVALKGEITEKNILQCLDVAEGHVLYFVAKELAEYIVKESEKNSSYSGKVYHSTADLMKEGYSQSGAKEYEQYFDKGMVLIFLYASYNEADYPIEWYLGNSSFKTENENIMMKVCSP